MNQYKVGSKFKVVSGGNFNIGQIVTLEEDYERGGFFVDSEGTRRWKQYDNVEAYTPKIIRGEEYVIIADVGLDGRYFRAGERVRSLDGRDYFESVDIRLPHQASVDNRWHSPVGNVEQVKVTAQPVTFLSGGDVTVNIHGALSDEKIAAIQAILAI